MTRYLVTRLGQGVISLVAITVIVFLLTRLLGDPIIQMLPPTHSQEEYDRLASALGYDQPLHVQFWTFAAGAITGDLGNSLAMARPVIEVLAERAPLTAALAIGALIFGYLPALAVGFWSGFRRSKVLSTFVTLAATTGIAIPSFAAGIFLIVIFAIALEVLPAGGWGTWQQGILPIATLAIWMFSSTVRIARSTMQERAEQQFVTLATTKGLSPTHVFLRHAVRPSLPPVISYAAVLAGTLFSGTVITETLFGIPGLGALAVNAVRNQDQPLVVGVVMLSAAIFILLNIVSDLIAAGLDPRVRLHGGAS